MGAKRKIPLPPYRRRHQVEIWGLEIVFETPDPLGGVLWQDLRHLRDWDAARPYRAGKLITPDRRGDLFNPTPPAWIGLKRGEAATFAPELREALDAFQALVRTPLVVQESLTANACETIADWARNHGYTETAIQFAEAAAVIDRQAPRRARLAGKLARDAGDYPRAEVWFERSIGLARKRKDWVEYTRAHLGIGIMYMTLGRESRAQRHFNTASTVAMREGHEWLAAEAQHDLFHFMTVRGRYVEGELHARRALAWYPKHNKRFPFFVADVAFLFVYQRHFGSAAELLKLFTRKVKAPHNVLGFSLMVRALAGAGKLAEFKRARERLLRLLASYKEYEAASRWNLAHGERAAGMWEAATENARLAIELAQARRDSETETLARQLLNELQAGTPAATEIRRTDDEFRELMNVLRGRLAEWSPTRRGRFRSHSRDDWAA